MEKSKLPTTHLIHKSSAIKFMFFSLAYGIKCPHVWGTELYTTGPGKNYVFPFSRKFSIQANVTLRQTRENVLCHLFISACLLCKTRKNYKELK